MKTRPTVRMIKNKCLILFLIMMMVSCGKGSNPNETDSILTSTDTPSATESPPNILLIIADDMGLDASPVHNEGFQKPHMPELESLSRNGITFDNFWVNPVCSPTRATILTGKYGVNSGVLGVSPGNNGVSTTEVSLQSYLSENSNYTSAVIGKWHLSNNFNGGVDNPELMGVQHYAGMISGAHSDYSDWTLTENGQMSNVQQYSTSYFTDKSIEWIEQQESSSDAPWFLWLAYTAPHTPFHLPPAELLSDNTLSGDEADVAADPLSYYLAMLEALDSEMGRLLDTVDMDNTMVIFMGDNGTPNQVVQSPYSRAHAKGSVYQGGINTPMVISGKGVGRSDQRESALINSTDLYATITDTAETGLRTIHNSVSFKNLLNGQDYTAREFIYAEVESNNLAWAIRNEQYKLIEFQGGTQELYDLIQDPYEGSELISSGLTSEQSLAKESLENYVSQIRGDNVAFRLR